VKCRSGSAPRENVTGTGTNSFANPNPMESETFLLNLNSNSDLDSDPTIRGDGKNESIYCNYHIGTVFQ
jgi:hypothetical protein